MPDRHDIDPQQDSPTTHEQPDAEAHRRNYREAAEPAETEAHRRHYREAAEPAEAEAHSMKAHGPAQPTETEAHRRNYYEAAEPAETEAHAASGEAEAQTPPDDRPASGSETQAPESSKSDDDDDGPDTEGHRFAAVSDRKFKDDIRPLLG